ncbi:MAG: hypothetical protein ACOYKE_03375 [Ferruginibacter sp.]
MSNTTNSSWQYRQTNNSTSLSTDYTLTATSRDTVINTKTYKVYTNSNGNTLDYYSISGNDYYNFRALGAALGNLKVENLYLKDNLAVSSTWTQSLNITVPGAPFPIPITLTYTIAEKGSTRTVNSITYTDVIKVTTAISSSAIPSASLVTDIQDFYARKFGAIESNYKLSLNFMGVVQNTDTKTILLSADIK